MISHDAAASFSNPFSLGEVVQDENYQRRQQLLGVLNRAPAFKTSSSTEISQPGALKVQTG